MNRKQNLKISLTQIGSLAKRKTIIMKEEEIKKLSLLEYILYIDSLNTEEFCNWQGIKHPHWTGNVQTSADMFLQVDVVKLRLIKEKAKLERNNKNKSLEEIKSEWDKRSDYIKESKNVNTEVIFDFFKQYFK